MKTGLAWLVRLPAGVVLLFGSAAASPVVAPVIERASSPPVRVALDTMPLGALVTLLMRDVLRVPYVIASDVVTDVRPFSVNLVMPREALPAKVIGFLRGVGLTVRSEGGMVYVAKKPMEAAGVAGAFQQGGTLARWSPDGFSVGGAVRPQLGSAPPQVIEGAPPGASSDGAPPVGAPGRSYRPDDPDAVTIVVTPAHRAVVELADILRTILPNLVVAARAGVVADGATIASAVLPDRIVVTGSAHDVDRATAILEAVDKPRATVAIHAVIMEVRTTRERGSALAVLASALGGKVEAGIGSLVPGEQFLKFAIGGFRAVLSAVANDGRFNIVAEPSLSAVSGTTATINSGSQVPTLGSVSFAQNSGTPTRSVIYRDSGVSLSVRPVVRGGEIELTVTQERSSFVRTNTGVDESPTLNKSSASALVTIQPGQTIAIAGLDERGDGNTRDGIFGGLVGSRSHTKNSSQLLLLVQADAVAPGPVVKPVIERLGDAAKPVAASRRAAPGHALPSAREGAGPVLPVAPSVAL